MTVLLDLLSPKTQARIVDVVLRDGPFETTDGFAAAARALDPDATELTPDHIYGVAMLVAFEAKLDPQAVTVLASAIDMIRRELSKRCTPGGPVSEHLRQRVAVISQAAADGEGGCVGAACLPAHQAGDLLDACDDLTERAKAFERERDALAEALDWAAPLPWRVEPIAHGDVEIFDDDGDSVTVIETCAIDESPANYAKGLIDRLMGLERITALHGDDDAPGDEP